MHIWPEFLASLTGTPLPLFRSPVIEDPAMAASVRRLHRALTGRASELERYEVAADAGFADQAHLTRWFRRYYGVTPGAYRAAAGGPAGR